MATDAMTAENLAWRAMAATVPERMIFVGVDLGQKESPTAVVVVERIEEMPGNYTDVLRGVAVRMRYVVRFAERMKLGTPYTEVVMRVKGLVGQLATRGNPVLVVDGSGVGVPIVEMMREVRMGCALYPIVITSGKRSAGSGSSSVPRVELVTKLQMMVERGELELAGCGNGGEQLRWELLHLRLDGGGGGEPDDLALALALACWKARVR